MRRTAAFPTRACCISLLLATFACTSPPPQEAVATRVENSTLDIAVSVPADFFVITAEGPIVVLERTGDPGPARLTIEATGEMPGGINLVAEAESMQDWFELQPDGQYFGNLELGTPTGPAFTARGSYTRDSTPVEELRVFALHPSANRMLRLTYSYPPGTGKERLMQLAEVLGEIEALDQSASDS